MNNRDFISLLNAWDINMKNRINELDTWARRFMFISINVKIISFACNAAVPLIAMYFLEDINYTLAGAIVMFSLEITAMIMSGFDLIFKPNKKSEDCFECKKGYLELEREISADILKHQNKSDYTSDYYFYLAGRYSARERIIVNSEPLILFYNHNRFEVINYIGDHNKSRFTKIKNWISKKLYTTNKNEEEEKEDILNQLDEEIENYERSL